MDASLNTGHKPIRHSLSSAEGATPTPRQRVGTRLVIAHPASEPNIGDKSARTSRVRRAATAAGTGFNLKDLTVAAINSAQQLLADDPKADQKIAKAVSDALACVHKYTRANFSRPEVQLAHFATSTHYQASIVAAVMAQVPKVQSSLVNLGTVMCIGGGPCSDSLGIMDYFIKNEKERQVGFSKLCFRVIEAEPQWQHTWRGAFETSGFNYIEFESGDFDSVTVDDAASWGLDKVDLFSMVFVAKPVFRAMWDETNKMMESIVDKAKEGAFFLWINHADAPVNKYFEKWMDQMLLQYSFDGKVSELHGDALNPVDIEQVTKMLGSLSASSDSNLFVRVYRKPKSNLALPHIERPAPSENRKVSGTLPTPGAVLSESDSDSSSSSDDDDADGEKKKKEKEKEKDTDE